MLVAIVRYALKVAKPYRSIGWPPTTDDIRVRMCCIAVDDHILWGAPPPHGKAAYIAYEGGQVGPPHAGEQADGLIRKMNWTALARLPTLAAFPSGRRFFRVRDTDIQKSLGGAV
jgi:hypothetical protein